MTLETALQAAGAILVPVLLALFLPRRWRMEGMLLWLLSPLALYLAVVIWEVLTRPVGPNALYNAVLGFMLISAIVAIPWLVICSVAFFVGLMLRGLIRRILGLPPEPRGKPPAPPLAVPPHWQAGAPDVPGPDPERRIELPPGPICYSQPPGGEPGTEPWRQAHFGFSNDGLVIDGTDVWAGKWHDSGAPSLYLPHPAYPQQRHRMDEYTTGTATPPLRFAAGELSNGVWGFYVPA